MLHLALMGRNGSFSFKPFLFTAFNSTLLILAVICGYWHRQTKKYQKLIIKNDSIMSVNIKLLNPLREKSPSKKIASVIFKTGGLP